jgi:hypothetical protein
MGLIRVQVLRCPWSKCKRRDDHTVEIDESEYRAVVLGTQKIQDAMPTTPAPIREQMMTGTHPECWDEMWKEEDR